MCDGRNHNLIRVYANRYSDDSTAVVRWCKECGSVAVDVDIDGRTAPGRIHRMRTPSYEMEKK